MSLSEIHLGDCLDVLPMLADSSVDAIVTDPPYGLVANKKGGSGVASVNLDSPYGRARIGTGEGPGGFMGQKWDRGVPGAEFWEAALRVAKPGGHLLAFGGTRTFHRLACAIEDAGWEIRDTIMWVYGSGFPKSLDVSKALDKAAGAEREVVGQAKRTGKVYGTYGAMAGDNVITAPATDAAREWSGWGTALKPAWEPIIVARKPLAGTVAANVQKYGCGALNIDGCRVGTSGAERLNGGRVSTKSDGWDRPWKHDEEAVARCRERGEVAVAKAEQLGRWPANLIHDGSEEVVGLFPVTKSGANPTRRGQPKFRNVYGEFTGQEECTPQRGEDSGSAARFFYCAKASRAERGDGNNHPTVKPLALMRYLCRLITPPGGTVLDPFCGSGTTGVAAKLEGFEFIGIEREPEYAEIAQRRIAGAEVPCGLF